MSRAIARKELSAWLDRLSKERTVVAPRHLQEGLARFQPVQNWGDVSLELSNLSPKEWLFPLTETLFTVERRDGRTVLVPAVVEEERVIIGLRPCDAHALALLDRALLEAPADTLYQQRRERTVLVGVACAEARAECFCTSVGGGPHDATHLDVLLTEVGEEYLVQVVSERGRALMEGAPLIDSRLSPPAPPVVGEVPAGGIVETARRVFDAPYWDRLADRCLHCNICAYVCPTCYCFDIRDYKQGGKVERVRTWESCESPGFTRIAGGYNPRSSKGARLRQRFYHKLLYFPEQYGQVACVGCGRCVISCPVNIDIREVISDMQKLEVKSG